MYSVKFVFLGAVPPPTEAGKIFMGGAPQPQASQTAYGFVSKLRTSNLLLYFILTFNFCIL